jgi:hypothetical protein
MTAAAGVTIVSAKEQIKLPFCFCTKQGRPNRTNIAKHTKAFVWKTAFLIKRLVLFLAFKTFVV